jgi:hypothetical protein
MGNTGYGNFFFFVHVAAPLPFFECVPTPFLYHFYLFSHASIYAFNTTICAFVFARLSCLVLSCLARPVRSTKRSSHCTVVK